MYFRTQKELLTQNILFWVIFCKKKKKKKKKKAPPQKKKELHFSIFNAISGLQLHAVAQFNFQLYVISKNVQMLHLNSIRIDNQTSLSFFNLISISVASVIIIVIVAVAIGLCILLIGLLILKR